MIDEDGSLVLEAVEEAHRGVFKCVAENALGRDERLIVLTVHTAPIIEGAEGIVSFGKTERSIVGDQAAE